MASAWLWSSTTFLMIFISIFFPIPLPISLPPPITVTAAWSWPQIAISMACLLVPLTIITLIHFLPLLILHHDHRHNNNNNKNLPKGSFGWPLLGETLGFLNPHPSTSLGTFLQDHCSRYGKVFRSHLFLSPTVVSCDQELNYFILQNEGKLFECSYPKPIHGILGNVSMLVAVGDTHRRLRNVALSLVNVTKSNPEFLHDVEMTATMILKSWSGKEQVLFCEEARKYSFNVIVKQVLGLTPKDPETTRILEDFLTFMKGLISLPLYVAGTPYARAVQARSRIASSVKAIIEERKRRRRMEGEGYFGKGKVDFLEILLGVETLSEDEKVSFVLDSLLGGYETTSLLLAMVVHFLGQSPLALSHLKVINEAMRCGNIVKFVHRKALKDVKFRVPFGPCQDAPFYIIYYLDLYSPIKELCRESNYTLPFLISYLFFLDYLIPSGWKVLPVFTAVHLDPSLHPNALKFDPWRWESEDQTSKKFTPFGGGLRCCPGSELAKVEIAFFLHHLVLQNFRWRTEDSDGPLAFPYVEFEKGLLLNLDHS
ncbi:unnamed protein product [Linum tenue]|uniref:Cytochrome P450 724B1 n=1 Tax=Linum tenue TaxID=586396 RepID=A0AAV0NLA6_9ROSI|nr:unnamed protein product [Linum tenue]